MRIQTLYDLQSEVNRLLIAGSRFAVDDPRIAKLLPVFEKMGEKVPVFKKLKTDVESLITDKSINSEATADKLLEISVLLYSILYTQGDMVPEGISEWNEIEPVSDDIKTEVSALRLIPLIENLTQSKSGRYEIVNDGFKNGYFSDVRTHKYLVRAIADSYSDIANLVCGKIIPSIGSKLIPYIKNDFNISGVQADARRLLLLNKLDSDRTIELAKRAINEGSVPVMVAAIEILGHYTENEDLLISLTGDKKKEIREAAILSLCRQGSIKGIDKALDIFNSKQYTSPIKGLRSLRNNKKVSDCILERIKSFYNDSCIEKENAAETKKHVEKALNSMNEIMSMLKNTDDDDVLDFYYEIMSNDKFRKLSDSYSTVNYIKNIIINNLKQNNSEKIYCFIVKLAKDKKVGKKNSDIKTLYFEKSVGTMSKKELYDEFNDSFLANEFTFNRYAGMYNDSTDEYDEDEDESDDTDNENDVSVETAQREPSAAEKYRGNVKSYFDERWLYSIVKYHKANSKKNNYYYNSDNIYLVFDLYDNTNKDHYKLMREMLDHALEMKYIPYYIGNLVESLFAFNIRGINEDYSVQKKIIDSISATISKGGYNSYYYLLNEEKVLSKFKKSDSEIFIKFYERAKNYEYFHDAAKYIAENGIEG